MSARRLGISLLCIVFSLGCSRTDPSAQQDSESGSLPFVLVMIDADDEKLLGGFPVDRALVARAIASADRLGARAVVLKFFYDQPSNPSSDALLAESIAAVPTLLQARIDETERHPNAMPQSFYRDGAVDNLSALIGGHAGWLPLPQFSHAAAGVGFVDSIDTGKVPAYESYQGHVVPSLTLATLEMALGSTSRIEDRTLHIGAVSMALDETFSFEIDIPSGDELEYLRFSGLVEGQLQANALRDKVVIIGYDGEKMPAVRTGQGNIRAHRLFYYGLVSAWRSLTQK